MLEIAWRAALLLGVGTGLGFAANALRSDGVALATFAPPVSCSAEGESASAAPVGLVSQTEAAALCADPGTQIADARSAQAYAEGHVAGAIHLPCSASERAAASAMSGLGATKLLLVYGDRTEDAWPVAEELRRRLGPAAPRIGVLEGGFSAWQAAGLACASGSCDECAASEHHDAPHEHQAPAAAKP